MAILYFLKMKKVTRFIQTVTQFQKASQILEGGFMKKCLILFKAQSPNQKIRSLTVVLLVLSPTRQRH